MKPILASLFAISMLFATQAFAGGGTQSQEMTMDESASKHRVEDFIGKSAYNREGLELGDVNDIVLDESGNPSHLIVSRSGVLGIGEELVPIPWDLTDRGETLDGAIIADIDMEKFENAPSFGSLDEFDPAGDEEVRAYYEGRHSMEDFQQSERSDLGGVE